MKHISQNSRIHFIALFVILCTSCTNLEEEIYSNLRSEQFFTDESNIVAAMAPIYSNFRPWLDWQSWWDIEESTDIAATPVRGYGWYDGGIYIRMHKHEWTAFDPHFEGIWNLMYNNINTCNRVIFQLENADFEIDGRDAYIAEIKAARAFIYYQLCSLYGNIPIVDRYDVAKGFLPTTSSRNEVIDFIINELTECIPYLSETVGGSFYGRFNKWTALTILARTYLNSEAWTGVSRWDSCLIACDQIISSGKFSLESNFRKNFALSNDQSEEIIFCFPWQENYANSLLYIAFRKSIHPEHLAKTYNAKTWADNGVVALPSFINTFSPDDKRLGWSFYMGQQYGSDGTPLKCTGIVPSDLDQPLVYTNTLSDIENAHEWEGYRFGKFEIKMETEWVVDNDWPAMRYAEVLFMKAEALLRSGGDKDEAANLVNQVRARAFEIPTPVTSDELIADVIVNDVLTPFGRMLMEWGWEFSGECLRREQLIRFNNFTTGTWTQHTPSESFRELFPIPQLALSTNKNLVQNPGYN